MGVGRTSRCSSVRGTFTAPSLEVTKSTCRFLRGCRVQGCLSLSLREVPDSLCSIRRLPRPRVPEHEDAVEAGSPSRAAHDFYSKESLLFCVFINGHMLWQLGLSPTIDQGHANTPCGLLGDSSPAPLAHHGERRRIPVPPLAVLHPQECRIWEDGCWAVSKELDSIKSFFCLMDNLAVPLSQELFGV